MTDDGPPVGYLPPPDPEMQRAADELRERWAREDAERDEAQEAFRQHRTTVIDATGGQIRIGEIG